MNLWNNNRGRILKKRNRLAVAIIRKKLGALKFWSKGVKRVTGLTHWHIFEITTITYLLLSFFRPLFRYQDVHLQSYISFTLDVCSSSFDDLYHSRCWQVSDIFLKLKDSIDITIAHCLNTIKDYEVILVMKNGEIDEIHSFKSLVNDRLWQFSVQNVSTSLSWIFSHSDILDFISNSRLACFFVAKHFRHSLLLDYLNGGY